MICQPCRDAADGVPGAEHCNAPARSDRGSWSCACQHRPPKRPAATGTVVIHVHPDPPRVAEAIRDVRRLGPGRR